jgi:hypothetical protein
MTKVSVREGVGPNSYRSKEFVMGRDSGGTAKNGKGEGKKACSEPTRKDPVRAGRRASNFQNRERSHAGPTIEVSAKKRTVAVSAKRFPNLRMFQQIMFQ